MRSIPQNGPSRRSEGAETDLRARGLRLTGPRRVVLDVVRATESHPTAEWVHRMVRRRLPRVSLGTVYRNLRVLVAEGLVKELSGPHARFDGNLSEHHHFTCLACGRISDVQAPTSDAPAAGRGAGARRGSSAGRRPRAAVTINRKEDVTMAGKPLKGSKSVDNLKDAFAGESQANRRYLYFARVADIEGFPDVAGLFKDTADAETGHAFGHLDFLKEVGDPATGEPIGKTEKNLKAAVAGETYEYTQMYPGMAKTARGEGFNELAEWFETLAKAEKSHAGRFNKGLQQIAGKDPAEAI